MTPPTDSQVPSEREEKFTPGPWTISKREGHAFDGERSVIHADGVARIAVVSKNGGATRDEAEANARLICSAPDLYAACKEAETILEWVVKRDGYQVVADALVIVRAALSTSTDQEPKGK